MNNDFRKTPHYLEGEALCRDLRQPGTGQVSDGAEISVAPGADYAVFAGTVVEDLEGTPPTRIWRACLSSGDLRALTFGPNSDRSPKYSPDRQQVAFLSDRRKAGDFQLYLLDPATGAVRTTPPVNGWVEYLHWSPDGSRILLGVAGYGADISGGQGAITSKKVAEDAPSWMPAVETGDESFRWRRAWVYDLAKGKVHQVSAPQSNIWEAVWCGNKAVAAVASPGPGEGLWYSANLQIVGIHKGEGREVYAPKDQLGVPAASPSGKRLAVVEALCSDRWIVAGDLLLIDTRSEEVQRVDTHGVDVTHAEWRSEDRLLVAGHRGLETVIGLYDAAAREFAELWASREITAGGRYANVSGFNDRGDCVLIGEGYVRAPEIAIVRGGKYSPVISLDRGYSDQAKVIESVEAVSWDAEDGLEMQGWLLRPRGHAPFPLVMNVHGGPVGHWRTSWLGRLGASNLMLLKRGYAVFYPNPRGSSGRGQAFARHVLGEMCGADATDCLSGVDHLIARGIADPKRLGVTGGSYGGLMTSWLITQDSRFAAAVSQSPSTNHVTQHLLSNIPHFVTLFLADTYLNTAGKYYQRSPIMHAHKARTPTLNICGGLDRCTPPAEAMQFHNALLENGVKSVLATYPEEGHGMRKFPAAIDCVARTLAWFEEHMPANVNE